MVYQKTSNKNDKLLRQYQAQTWDLVVIGGGITGVGIALECQKLGLKVLLLERQDFSWGTSSKSSKMVHGGLRYLASGDINTTRHSVKAREMLMQSAPGLVDLMYYLFPHYRATFPGPKIFGLLLKVYDWLAGKKYRRRVTIDETAQIAPHLKKEQLIAATEFVDAVTDDSRLVLRLLNEFKNLGGTALNYVDVIKVESTVDNQAVIHCRPNDGHYGSAENTNHSYQLTTTRAVNATGAWANQLRPRQVEQAAEIRPARGSHLVISSHRLTVTHSLTLQNPVDGRPIFIYPWMGRTVIGTTDLDHGAVGTQDIGISSEELSYLLAITEFYFPSAKITAKDVLTSWAGVRPLVSSGAQDPSSEKRDHSIWRDAALITVSGGKLTTFLTIAADVIERLQDAYEGEIKQVLAKYTDPTLVKGYRLFGDSSDCQQTAIKAAIPSHLNPQVVRRLSGYYGAALEQFKWHQKLSETIPDSPYFWSELRWSAEHEAVCHLDDLLLRRLRLGYILPDGGCHLARDIQAIVSPVLDWDEQRWRYEWQRYVEIWRNYYFLPVDQQISQQSQQDKASKIILN